MTTGQFQNTGNFNYLMIMKLSGTALVLLIPIYIICKLFLPVNISHIVVWFSILFYIPLIYSLVAYQLDKNHNSIREKLREIFSSIFVVGLIIGFIVLVLTVFTVKFEDLGDHPLTYFFILNGTAVVFSVLAWVMMPATQYR
jgi:hypothetical protein